MKWREYIDQAKQCKAIWVTTVALLVTIILLDKSRLEGIASLAQALAWPASFALLLWHILRSEEVIGRIGRLFGPFRSVKLFAAEFVLSEEAKQSTEEILGNYRRQVKQKFDLWSQRKNLAERFNSVIQQDLYVYLESKDIDYSDFRFTLHVPDLLLDESLYQLTDYYPYGSGSGRVKSVRFGIIGKAWRSTSSEIEGDVTINLEKLTKEWGMTRREAANAGAGRQTFAAVLLCDAGGTRIGVFYMDSKKKNALCDPSGITWSDDFRKRVLEACDKHKIIQTLVELSDELRGQAPLIKVYD